MPPPPLGWGAARWGTAEGRRPPGGGGKKSKPRVALKITKIAQIGLKIHQNGKLDFPDRIFDLPAPENRFSGPKNWEMDCRVFRFLLYKRLL